MILLCFCLFCEIVYVCVKGMTRDCSYVDVKEKLEAACPD